MDMQKLRFFRAVAVGGSLSEAARKLNYAQSNLSRKIRDLEVELGADLFYRRNTGMILTPQGELLLDYATRLLGLAAEAEEAVKSGGAAAGPLTIGAGESAIVAFLPSLLPAFSRDNPAVRLTIKDCITGEAISGVLDHSLDGAFTPGEISRPGLAVKRVGSERLALVSAAGEAAAPLGELLRRPLLVFPRGCYYRAMLGRWLDSIGLPPGETVEFTSHATLVANVIAGLGVSLLTEVSVAHYVAAGLLASHRVPGEYSAAPMQFLYREDGFMKPSLRRFIEALGGARPR